MPAWDPWPWLPEQLPRHTHRRTLKHSEREEKSASFQHLAFALSLKSLGVQMIHVLLIQEREYERSKWRLVVFFKCLKSG